jgi:hypothetical protein
MRVFVLADSHGRGMDTAMRQVDATMDVRVISHAGPTPSVWERYLAREREITEFDPQSIVFHVGHNDLMYHPVHNIEPIHPICVYPMIMSYYNQLVRQYPTARVIYSSVYPRTVGNYMDFEMKASYNYQIYLFGKSVIADGQKRDHRYVLNRTLWFSPRQSREHPVFFLRDGIHLKDFGKEAVARGWVKAIKSA